MLNFTYYRCTFRNRTQLLANLDICEGSTKDALAWMLESIGGCDVVYSDPPWNPGNEKYWRNHAQASESRGYDSFLRAWCDMAKVGIEYGAKHVLCEQSANEKHCRMMVDAASRADWGLPLIEQWTVFYGTPGSASVRRPNVLLHFGSPRITTDPTGMAGEPMTVRVCAGLRLPQNSRVVDFCMGKGMVSRMAHYFDWDCVGTELNAKRLSKTLEWLRKQGYQINEQSTRDVQGRNHQTDGSTAQSDFSLHRTA